LTARTDTVGLIAPALNPYCANLVFVIKQRAAENSLSVVIRNTNHSGEARGQDIDLFLQDRHGNNDQL